MGAPLDRAAALRYQELLSPRIFNGYGTTETFWNTFLRPEDFPDGAGSTGRASTDDDVAVVRVYEDRLADPTDTVAKDGTEIGEFAVRTVKSGYSYRNPGLEAEKFANGWFYPGDLATWDEHERVTIVGRKDDMVISGGENVHPVQVEAVLQEHPGRRRLHRGRACRTTAVGRGRHGVRRPCRRPAAGRRRRGSGRARGVDGLPPGPRPVQAPAAVPLRHGAALQRHRQEGALPGEGRRRRRMRQPAG